MYVYVKGKGWLPQPPIEFREVLTDAGLIRIERCDNPELDDIFYYLVPGGLLQDKWFNEDGSVNWDELRDYHVRYGVRNLFKYREGGGLFSPEKGDLGFKVTCTPM